MQEFSAAHFEGEAIVELWRDVTAGKHGVSCLVFLVAVILQGYRGGADDLIVRADDLGAVRPGLTCSKSSSS